MNFRQDINGLRSLAVVAVVLFHFGVHPFAGGFVGVDIFFVISGFLMTKIIFTKLETGSFSLWKFYLDRAKRILPALIVLCLFLLVAGWLLLTPLGFRALGKYIASSLVFVSNIVFWKEAGYFDVESHEKWLLHTWSLSVEWQFYTVYPLILLAAARYASPRQTKWIVVGLTALSFMASAILSKKMPTSSFFFLTTRAWEMLAGGLIVLFPLRLGKRTKHVMEFSGLALMAYSILAFDALIPWPGYMALIPVLGAALLIAANNQRSIFTSNSVAQFLGTTSYSIYLWHWPVVIGLGYLDRSNDPLAISLAMLLSVALGWLSYKIVEDKFRSTSRTLSTRAICMTLVLPIALLFGVGGLTYVRQGFPERMTPAFNAATKDGDMPTIENGWCFYSVDTMPKLSIGAKGLSCRLGAKTHGLDALLFGDSYAGHAAPFWDKIGKENSIGVNAISTNWCYSSTGTKYPSKTSSRAHDQCVENRNFLAKNYEKFDFVVFASSWGTVWSEGQLGEVFSTIDTVSQKKLVIIMAAPTYYDSNIRLRFERNLVLGRPYQIDSFSKASDESVRQANEELKKFAESHSNVMFLDRDDLFSDQGIRSDVTRENIPYSFDGNHLSIFGSLKSADSFANSAQYQNFKRRLSSLRAGK